MHARTVRLLRDVSSLPSSEGRRASASIHAAPRQSTTSCPARQSSPWRHSADPVLNLPFPGSLIRKLS